MKGPVYGQLALEEKTSKEKSALKAAKAPMLQATRIQIQHVANRQDNLSTLIPGYTAPLHLAMLHGTKTGSRNATTMSDLTKNAMAEEIQQTAASRGRTNRNNAREEAKCFKTGRMIGCISSSVTSASLSKGWLGFRPTPTSEEVQADIALLRNRNYLDPKRFYKSSDGQSGKRRSIVQVGTVIEGAAEFYSSRLTKKEKRSNVTDEVLADTSLSGYVQNKSRSMQRQKTAESKKAKRRKTGRSRK